MKGPAKVRMIGKKFRFHSKLHKDLRRIRGETKRSMDKFGLTGGHEGFYRLGYGDVEIFYMRIHNELQDIVDFVPKIH